MPPLYSFCAGFFEISVLFGFLHGSISNTMNCHILSWHTCCTSAGVIIGLIVLRISKITKLFELA